MASHLKPKRLRPSLNTDRSYFESYADITVHEEMLGDGVRTNIYKRAIFDSKSVIKDKVVLDVGAGTGILSCFCAKAGARKVYAVEASSIAEQAKKVVDANGLQDQIVVIQGVLEDITLPEKVDVIVSEWMGYCLLYESMLTSVITARNRWLKEGGILLPDTALIYISPICDDEIMVEKVNFWNDMEEIYGVDMSCMLPFARKSLSKEVMVKSISSENILSRPQLIASFDLNKVTHRDIQSVHHQFKFSSFGIADFQGFAVWFDVLFPLCGIPGNKCLVKSNVNNTHACDLINANKIPQVVTSEMSNHPIDLSEGCRTDTNHVSLSQMTPSKIESQSAANQSGKDTRLILSTSPYRQETHWKQSLLYLDSEIEVSQDSTITGSVTLTPCIDNYRFLTISLNCRVDDGPHVNKTYVMGYELPNDDKGTTD